MLQALTGASKGNVNASSEHQRQMDRRVKHTSANYDFYRSAECACKMEQITKENCWGISYRHANRLRGNKIPEHDEEKQRRNHVILNLRDSGGNARSCIFVKIPKKKNK